MRNWITGGCAVALAVTAAIVFTPPKSNPPAPPAPAPLVADRGPVPAAPTGTEPVVLAEVIDVTDIDPLLDPPAIPHADPGPSAPMLTAVGYEIAAPRPVEPATPVVPIPPAVEGQEEERPLAPLPRVSQKQ